MRREPESTQPVDVVDHIARVAGEAVRRLANAERDVMAIRSADLDRIDDKNTIDVPRRIGCSKAVAVVGEDDKVESCAVGRSCHIVRGSRAIRTRRVDMNCATYDTRIGRKRQLARARRQQGPDDGDDRDGDSDREVAAAWHLWTRMEAIVHSAQASLEHVRVDLCRGQVGVAEHHLDRAQVRATLEQVRRERVPQDVRAQALRNPIVLP